MSPVPVSPMEKMSAWLQKIRDEGKRAGLARAAELAREYRAAGEQLHPRAADCMVSFAELLERLAEEE